MKKFLMILISIALVIVTIILGLKGFRYLVTDDTHSYTRLMMHDLYNQEENIDVLFVGSSHCYRSVVPSIVDEKLNCHSFNCGSSAQKMDGSLALIKETLKYYEPKIIVLDLYYEMIDTVSHAEREVLTSTYAISDYMKLSWNKISYLLNASSTAYYFNSFIVGRRNWKKIFDLEYMEGLIEVKTSEAYKGYMWEVKEGDEGYYSDRGYVAFDGKLGNYVISDGEIHIDIDSFTDEWKNELKEIINICKSNNIELMVVATPLPVETLNKIDNYSEYVSYIDDLLIEYSIKYIDFNTTDNVIEGIDEDCFMDGDHLNSLGAQIYTNELVKHISIK